MIIFQQTTYRIYHLQTCGYLIILIFNQHFNDKIFWISQPQTVNSQGNYKQQLPTDHQLHYYYRISSQSYEETEAINGIEATNENQSKN